MSVLPTVLIALGMLCILFTCVAILYSIISFIVIFDPAEIGYDNLFFARPSWLESKVVASVLNFLIFFSFTPVLLFSLIYFEYEHAGAIALISMFTVPVLFVYYAFTPNKSVKEERFRVFGTLVFWKSVITFFYINLFAFLSVVVYFKYLEFGLKFESDMQYLIAFLVFFAFSYFVLLPPKKKNNFQKNAEVYTKKKFSSEILKIPAFYVYSFSLLLTLIPSISYSTASVSFQFLNVGGGIERSYYFSKRSKVTVPPDLIESCVDDDYCRTKVVSVVFDIGGVLYVRASLQEEGGALISLPKSNLYMISGQQKQDGKFEGVK